MSSEWKRFQLQELGRIVTGKTPSTSQSEYFGGAIPFLTPTDMLDGQKVVSTARTLTATGLATVKNCLVPRGVAVSCIGWQMGKAVLIFAPTVTNQQINTLVVNESRFDLSFVYYLLTSMRPQIFELGATPTRTPIVNKSTFGRISVVLPGLAEQRRVANLCTALDDRIGLLRETNATLEAIAQTLFKSWFVDFDPVRAKQQGLVPTGMDEATAALFPDCFEESMFGLVPRGWRILPIREVVDAVYDGPHATPPEAADGPIFLGIKNLTGTGLDLTETRHISEDDWARWTRRVTPRSGDMVFSYEATLGFFALVPPSTRCCLGRRLALIRPKAASGHGHFWYHQFIAAPFQQLLNKHTIQGATVNRIALKEFPGYSVISPPDSLTGAFEECVAPLWARVHQNHAQAQTLSTLRDTLLPRLISGRLRLPQAEAELAEATA